MKKAVGILVGLLACTLLCSGCGEDGRVEKISFDSMQSSYSVTLNVSGKLNEHRTEKGFVYYSDKRTKEEMLDELKQNNLTYFELDGYEFFTMKNGQGTYYVDMTEYTPFTEVTIYDMTCMIGDLTTLFPAFLLETRYTAMGDIDNRLGFGTEYVCKTENILQFVKSLGLWTVEEQADSFIMRYQTESILVHVGDGTVTLEYVVTTLPEVISYETNLSEEEILADLGGKYPYSIQEYAGERYVLSRGTAYRVVITPQTGKDFKNYVLLDPLITEISTADRSTVCTMPFPYFWLSSNGETCIDELTFNGTYDVNKHDFLLYLRSVRGWSIAEDGDTVVLKYYNLAVKLIFDGDTVTIYPCE